MKLIVKGARLPLCSLKIFRCINRHSMTLAINSVSEFILIAVSYLLSILKNASKFIMEIDSNPILFNSDSTCSKIGSDF